MRLGKPIMLGEGMDEIDLEREGTAERVFECEGTAEPLFKFEGIAEPPFEFEGIAKPLFEGEGVTEIESEGVRSRNKENPEDPLLEMFPSLNPLSSSRCIYRVPKRLRQGNEKAYTPQVVSIGPLHHGEKPLKAMEEHKLRYLPDFLRRTKESSYGCIQIIKEQEEKLRSFYADSIEFGSDDFATIVLVDAAFVIELLLRNSYQALQDPDDYIFKNPRMLWDVRPDLQLLENQLPFFILCELFNKLHCLPRPPSLPVLSYLFFEKIIDDGGNEEVQHFVEKVQHFVDEKIGGNEVQHFVDLRRILYRPLEPKEKHKIRDAHITATPNVTELHQAGAKFTVGKGSSIFDIKFSGGILEIPKLTVDDTTDLKLRNFLAFEQCHHRKEAYLANYVFLMKRLVKTQEDVQFLVEKGIIENWLGDTKKISTLLHDLGSGMMIEHHYYATLCKDLIEFRGKCWPRWMVTLKQDYFHTPWAIFSLCAAVILLILTIVQTVCSIISLP